MFRYFFSLVSLMFLSCFTFAQQVKQVLDSTEFEVYEEGLADWYSSQRLLWKYDKQGELLSWEIKSFNIEIEKWNLIARQEFIYNSENQIIETSTYEGGSDEGSWIQWCNATKRI
jgi:hypothetical protein